MNMSGANQYRKRYSINGWLTEQRPLPLAALIFSQEATRLRVLPNENEMVSVITPDFVYGLFNSLLRKGILANENDNCSLQKFSAAVVHTIVSGAYTFAYCDQIRRKRAEETSHGQRFR
jgi:hypothetical protein